MGHIVEITVFTPADLKACWIDGEDIFLKFLAKLVLQADKNTKSTLSKSSFEISAYVSNPSLSLSLASKMEEFLKLL